MLHLTMLIAPADDLAIAVPKSSSCNAPTEGLGLFDGPRNRAKPLRSQNHSHRSQSKMTASLHRRPFAWSETTAFGAGTGFEPAILGCERTGCDSTSLYSAQTSGSRCIASGAWPSESQGISAISPCFIHKWVHTMTTSSFRRLRRNLRANHDRVQTCPFNPSRGAKRNRTIAHPGRQMSTTG